MLTAATAAPLAQNGILANGGVNRDCRGHRERYFCLPRPSRSFHFLPGCLNRDCRGHREQSVNLA